jgi:hypothetical protein
MCFLDFKIPWCTATSVLLQHELQEHVIHLLGVIPEMKTNSKVRQWMAGQLYLPTQNWTPKTLILDQY